MVTASVTYLNCSNASFYNVYIDPAVVDSCSFTQNVCMNKCSIVSLEVSRNFSFVSLHNINALLQNLSQTSSVSTVNFSITTWNSSSPILM